MQAGARINEVDLIGSTALTIAAFNGFRDVVRSGDIPGSLNLKVLIWLMNCLRLLKNS